MRKLISQKDEVRTLKRRIREKNKRIREQKSYLEKSVEYISEYINHIPTGKKRNEVCDFNINVQLLNLRK